MLKVWTRLSREQKRTWGILAGAVVGFSVIKVAYFGLARNHVVKAVDKHHLDGMERLREAREFAEWSKKDREARLPKITDEQRDQLRNYLQLVEQHGVKKALENAEDCVGCPIFSKHPRKQLPAANSTSAEHQSAQTN